MSSSTAKHRPQTADDTKSVQAMAPLPEPLPRVQQFFDAGKPQEALDLLQPKYSMSVAMQNARAVCLLRLNRPQDAIRVLRNAIMVSGGLTFRDDLPEAYVVNFALALAMTGQVSGAAGVLRGLRNPNAPAALELRQAIREWERELSWPAWIFWKGGLEQARPWTPKFVPGTLA